MELYRPPNGTEGEGFKACWCEQCRKYSWCTIPDRTMLFLIEDVEYPKQWQWIEGKPVCIRFDDNVYPIKPDRTNKNQLVLFEMESQ